MKRLLLVALLITHTAYAEVPLQEATKKLCQEHPVKLQCEQLVTSMLTHAYVTGQTKIGCELGIVEACASARTVKQFNPNVQWLEKALRKP